MPFIEGSKFKTLRDASKNGDEKAIAILRMYLDGKDFSKDIEDYFTPVQPKQDSTPEIEIDKADMTGLEKFLMDNNVSKDSEDYQEYVDEYYTQFPNAKREEIVAEQIEPEQNEFECLLDAENSCISLIDKAILTVANDANISETVKSGLINKLQRIKEDKLENLSTIKEIIKTIDKEAE